MAPQRRYNPPPNWPTPPPGWTPDPSWQPDPAWGPPPEGWTLWVTERPNSHPFGRGFLAAGVWWLLSVILVVALSQGQADLAYAIGVLTPGPVIAAVVTGLIARSRPTRWSIWMYLLWTFLFVVVLRLITVAGQLGG